ncbi:MAG: hypothetical protein Q9P01_13020 [Anaerolineae bacterium]|nr:hypothetical protein [Anaerolineae bacterium]MDQ7035713.1 hypothetical protein [Anaerolineae bacterium]
MPYKRGNVWLVVFLGLLFATMLMVTILVLWADKVGWREAVINVAETRSTTEVGLTLIAPASPVTYYARFYPLTAGITIDIGWRQFTPNEIQAITTSLDNNVSVWAILDMQIASSWDALAALSNRRGVGYRDSVEGTIFYRFDESSNDNLVFQFGDINPIPVVWGYQSYRVGDSICPADFALANQSHTVEISLIQEATPITRVTNDCLTVPEDADMSHVRLSLMNNNGQRLPISESGNPWGDFLVIGAIAHDEAD